MVWERDQNFRISEIRIYKVLWILLPSDIAYEIPKSTSTEGRTDLLIFSIQEANGNFIYNDCHMKYVHISGINSFRNHPKYIKLLPIPTIFTECLCELTET